MKIRRSPWFGMLAIALTSASVLAPAAQAAEPTYGAGLSTDGGSQGTGRRLDLSIGRSVVSLLVFAEWARAGFSPAGGRSEMSNGVSGASAMDWAYWSGTGGRCGAARRGC